jgi:membrane fusion protein, multidrug efflux system
MTDSDRTSAPPSASRSRRGVLLIGMTSVFVAVLAGFLLYQHFYGSVHESTEDAYVSGNLVQLTPQISGTALATTPMTRTSCTPARRS